MTSHLVIFRVFVFFRPPNPKSEYFPLNILALESYLFAISEHKLFYDFQYISTYDSFFLKKYD